MTQTVGVPGGPRQTFKGSAGVMGWKRQQAGGDLVGSGLLLSPAVLSASFLAEGAVPGQKATEKKAKRQKKGFRCGLWTGGGAESVRECVCVFCDGRPLPSPVLTHSGTA